MLEGKKILLGVTGSIAAYKAAILVRLLVKRGAEVKVILTESASQFVTPLTLSVLSKNEVYKNFEATNTTWNNHVELGLWADVMLIAPASANTMAKMVQGICDNFLLACYLSAKCTVMFAPAMDRDMYLHPSTQKNIDLLKSYGNILIPPADGELASGLSGKGRMEEPEAIVAVLEKYFAPEKGKLFGKRILINTGATREAIDPVRYISNNATGKMGFALAEEAALRGASVVLVAGNSQQVEIHRNIKRVNVTSASEMAEVCINHFKETDIAILTAAVADYRPVHAASQKLKKQDDTFTLSLIKNTDIAYELGQLKSKQQLLIGFALETENEESYARAKLLRKNLDLIVLNSLNDKGAGFGTDTNKIKIFTKEGEPISYELKSKTEVAADILNEIEKLVP